MTWFNSIFCIFAYPPFVVVLTDWGKDQSKSSRARLWFVSEDTLKLATSLHPTNLYANVFYNTYIGKQHNNLTTVSTDRMTKLPATPSRLLISTASFPVLSFHAYRRQQSSCRRSHLQRDRQIQLSYPYQTEQSPVPVSFNKLINMLMLIRL